MADHPSTSTYTDTLISLQVQEHLSRLYARIPKVKGCRTDCNACCGPVPMKAEEAAKVVHMVRPVDAGDGEFMTRTKANCLTCVYHTAQGCSIYEARPLMCRLFGAADDPMLTCPFGAKAKRPLSREQVAALVAEYQGMANG